MSYVVVKSGILSNSKESKKVDVGAPGSRKKCFSTPIKKVLKNRKRNEKRNRYVGCLDSMVELDLPVIE
jgi:hypothetical protein